MKKFVAVFSILCTTITLISCAYIFIQFEAKENLDFEKYWSSETPKVLITSSSDSPSEIELQNLLLKERTIHKNVRDEVKSRGFIINNSKSALIFIFGLLIVLFHINIYFLVTAFQEKKSN